MAISRPADQALTRQLAAVKASNEALTRQLAAVKASMGLAVSGFVHVDDTGARHQGNNGYCTHIGNELFAYFESTPSKSRINFLERLERKKRELLLVLVRPEIPLENNLSERDIREYVKKRKISGSTRNEQGRRCRDSFASLKKTCRKHGVSFWSYLQDRLFSQGKIPMLSELIRQRAEHSRAHGVEQMLAGSKAA